MKRHVFPLLLVVWLATGMFALSQAKKAEKVEPAPDEAVDDILLRSELVAPAFKADARLRLVEHNAVASKRKQIELLEAAFEYGREAADKTMMASGRDIEEQTGDTLAANASIDLSVDRLSLSCRAVLLMLERDPKRAKEMFERIPEDLWIEKERPETGTMAMPAPYYFTLSKVVGMGFTAEERELGLDVDLAIDRLGAIRSAGGVRFAARALQEMDIPIARRADVVRAFAKSLATMEPSDRAFLLVVTPECLEALASIADLADTPATKRAYLGGVRSFLVHHLGGVRRARTINPEYEESMRREANRLFKFDPEIAPEDIRPARIEAAGLDGRPEAFGSGEGRALLDELRALRFERRELKDDDTAKRLDWQQRYFVFRDGVRAYLGKSELSDADLAYERSALYGALVEMALSPDERASVIDEFLALHGLVNQDQIGPAEWLFDLSNFSMYTGDQAGMVWDRAREQSDARLSLYGALGKIGAGYESRMKCLAW